jgi:OOP family OmpA-OmpF porin
MKLAKASGTLGLAALAALGSQFAMAQSGAGGAAGSGAAMGHHYAAASDTGWYLGANVGRSRANIDESGISSRLLGAGFTASTISNDDSDTGYKLFAGYKFNRNFALEGGYFDLGRFSYTATTVPAGTLKGNIKLNGVNLDAVGILPISRNFSAFGRVGVNYAQAKDSFSGTGAVTVLNTNPSKSEANYKYGAGLQYDFSNALGMRFEAERYRINDAVGSKGDVDLLSVGLVYRFSAK